MYCLPKTFIQICILIFSKFLGGQQPCSPYRQATLIQSTLSLAKYCLSHRYKMHPSAVICPEFDILFMKHCSYSDFGASVDGNVEIQACSVM